MLAPKFSTLMTATALLLSPQTALACVQFSLVYKALGEGTLTAALSDNGQQKCQIPGVAVPYNPVGTYNLYCIAGYSASFDFDNGYVHYAYGSFSGDFSTASYWDTDRSAQYYTANVWGC